MNWNFGCFHSFYIFFDFMQFWVISGYLYLLTKVVIGYLNIQTSKGAKRDLLKALTKPLTSLVVKVCTFYTTFLERLDCFRHFKMSYNDWKSFGQKNVRWNLSAKYCSDGNKLLQFLMFEPDFHPSRSLKTSNFWNSICIKSSFVGCITKPS